MKRIDISNWKEFKIGDLFEIKPSKHYSLLNKDLFVENWINHVIVNSSFNNWIWWYTNLETTEMGNAITFSDTTNADSIFYQKSSFVGYPHIQVVRPKSFINKWTKKSLLFFAILFKKSAWLMNYDYVNKFTRSGALQLKIYLPTTSSWEPDWDYMENYIKELETRERESILLISNYLNKLAKNKINVHNWKRFKLYDENLFEIFSGSKLDKRNMLILNPTINFVGRSIVNNWVTDKVDIIPNIKPYQAWDITLALWWHYLGACFIQKEQFYTSQNVVVLQSKMGMSWGCKFFITIMVFKEAQMFYKAFEDELNRHIKTDFSILLPAKEDNTPDREYMETFVDNMKTRQKQLINSLKILGK